MAVFPENFIYRGRQRMGFGPLTIVGRPLISGFLSLGTDIWGLDDSLFGVEGLPSIS